MRRIGALGAALLALCLPDCSGEVETYGPRDAGAIGDGATVLDAAAAGVDSGPSRDGGSSGADAASAGPDAAPAGPDAAAAGPDAAAPGRDASTPDGGPYTPCPSPLPKDCSPGTGTGNQDQCFDSVPCYQGAVRNAINGCIASNPTWFDTAAAGSPLVYAPHTNDYVLCVVATLSAGNLCAIQDPNAGDEIVVKHDNLYSENFDILTADNHVRNAAWTATCAPAWF